MASENPWLQLRFDLEHLEMLDEIGDELVEQGVSNLKRAGKINRSAVIRYLIEREYRVVKENKGKRSKE